MTEDAPDRPSSLPARGVPLLIVAELPRDVFAWADALRRRHYPPDRNRLAAHVTLFHGLPPSAHGEVVRLLADLATSPPPEARLAGIMDLGRGTALAVDSPGMAALHREMAGRLSGLIQQKDAQPVRLHVTVQNKVSAAGAHALQDELARTVEARSFRFRGLGLYGWTGEIWQQLRIFPFRGTGDLGS